MPPTPTDLQLFTDPSGSLGYGEFLDGLWFQGDWLLEDTLNKKRGISIEWQELFPSCLACVLWGPTWGPTWSGKHILMSNSPGIMDLVRSFTLLTLINNFTISATHIPGLLTPFPIFRWTVLGPGSHSLSHSLRPISISNDHLTASVQRYFRASLAPSTRRTYQAGQKHFLTYNLMHGLVGPTNPLLPASELTLIYFACHLAKPISYDTVKLYLVAFQDLHRELNLSKFHNL